MGLNFWVGGNNFILNPFSLLHNTSKMKLFSPSQLVHTKISVHFKLKELNFCCAFEEKDLTIQIKLFVLKHFLQGYIGCSFFDI